MHDMQAKPLFISISAEKGRDDIDGVIYPLIENILHANEHLSIDKVDVKETEHAIEVTACLRASKETEQ